MQTENSNFSLYFISKWLAIVLAIFLIEYLLITNLQWQPNQEPIQIPQIRTPKFLNIWYLELEGLHLLLRPFFFDTNRQKFHNQVLNKQLRASKLYYYKLHLINFSAPPLAFIDSKNLLTCIFSSREAITNIPISTLMGQPQQHLAIIFKAFTHTAKVAPGHMQQYLVAFSQPIEAAKNAALSIILHDRKHLFSRLSCLRRDFDEYLQSPRLCFWQKSPEEQSENF